MEAACTHDTQQVKQETKPLYAQFLITGERFNISMEDIYLCNIYMSTF